MQKIQGQGLNPGHCSNNNSSLTRWATRELCCESINYKMCCVLYRKVLRSSFVLTVGIWRFSCDHQREPTIFITIYRNLIGIFKRLITVFKNLLENTQKFKLRAGKYRVNLSLWCFLFFFSLLKWKIPEIFPDGSRIQWCVAGFRRCWWFCER